MESWSGCSQIQSTVDQVAVSERKPELKVLQLIMSFAECIADFYDIQGLQVFLSRLS
jgi:hypothetical protein